MKTMDIIFMDGTYKGLIEYTSEEWHGIAYRIPRSELESGKYDNINELKNSGIYFLFGVGDTDNAVVYVGQSTDIFSRLKQHIKNPEKNYYTEAVIFMGSSSRPLDSGRLDWLENYFYEIIEKAKRYELKTKIVPKNIVMRNNVKIELNDFSEKVMTILGFIGHNIFETAGSIPQGSKDYKLQDGNMKKEATGYEDNGKFTVIKGSGLCPENIMPKNLPKWVTNLRVINSDKIDTTKWEITKDIDFKSPASAETFVRGTLGNGSMWK